MAAWQVARLVGVLALLAAAAAAATPPGRLPLALRGVYRILRRDAGLPEDRRKMHGAASAGRRALAFAAIVLAVVLALA